MDVQVGDVIQTKKPHPCGASRWLVLRTGAGTLVVSGEGLHIGKLSLDGGELHVDGRIDALTYEDAPEERGGSFFSRLFA